MKNLSILLTICVVVLSSCDKVDFEKLEINKPYTGLYQGKDCVVLIDHAEAGNVTGRIYLDEGNLVASPIPFTSDVKKTGKGKLFIQSQQKRINEIVIEDDRIQGELDKSAFSLKLYQETELPYKAEYLEQNYDMTIDHKVYATGVKGYWSSYPDSGEKFLTIYLNRADSLITTKELDLDLDVYCPQGQSRGTLRPLLVLIHGGAFYNGDKQDLGLPEIGRHFAKRGYVVASINYRLGFVTMAGDVDRAGYRALQDANAAVRYMIDNANVYSIDTTKIYAAGISAGAITALNLAFMHEDDRPESTKDGGVRGWIASFVSPLSTGMKVARTGGHILSRGAQLFGLNWDFDWDFDIEKEIKNLDLDTNLGSINAVNEQFSQPFRIKAVVNMWGAVHKLEMLQNSRQTDILSFHGDIDRIVPFNDGYPFSGVLESIVDSLVIGLPKPINYFAKVGRQLIDLGKPFNEWAFGHLYGSSQIHQRAKSLGMYSEFHPAKGCKHSLHTDDYKTLSCYFNDTIMPVMTHFLCREVVGGKIVRLARTGSMVEALEMDNVTEIQWQAKGGVILSKEGDNKVKALLFGDVPNHYVTAGGKYKNGIEFKESIP